MLVRNDLLLRRLSLNETFSLVYPKTQTQLKIKLYNKNAKAKDSLQGLQ
jgi:hypothetical protein